MFDLFFCVQHMRLDIQMLFNFEKPHVSDSYYQHMVTICVVCVQNMQPYTNMLENFEKAQK